MVTERKFKRCVVATCAACIGLSASAVNQAIAADESKAKVEVSGLRIAGKGYGDDGMMRPFNGFPGVSIALLVTDSSGGLIAFDGDASEVTSMTDDKGTDLLVKGEYMFPGFSGMDQISEDGKALLTEISGGGIPAKGAKVIKAKGKIVVHSASEQKAHRAEKVAVKKDTELKAGDVGFTITEVGQPDWGDMAMRVDLRTTDNIDAIAGVKFLDGDGKEIESERAGSMTMQMGSMSQVTYQFNLAKKVDSVTVEVTYWTDMRKQSIPFDIEVGVGL